MQNGVSRYREWCRVVWGWNRLRTEVVGDWERAGIERRLGKGKKGKRELNDDWESEKRERGKVGGIRKNEFFLGKMNFEF